jgi:hypothetical protein
MTDCNDIPAAGRVPFEADEVLIYGVHLNAPSSRIVSVPVTSGGSGYTIPPIVTFKDAAGRGAVAVAKIKSGAVTGIRMKRSGAGYTAATKAELEGGDGKDAKLGTPVLGPALPVAVLNLDGSWDLAIEGLFTRRRERPDPQFFHIVAAYGYAFEGHCYRFDRPRILAFAGPNGDAARGCGYDIPANLGYNMWRIKSNRRIIELTATVDDVAKTVLEANMPGRRPPNTYSAHMQLAHRGGRLTS